MKTILDYLLRFDCLPDEPDDDLEPSLEAEEGFKPSLKPFPEETLPFFDNLL